MRKPVKNIGASVRARLLALAKERNQPFELLLTRYTLERLLYRLSTSRYRDRFVLKGAMLLAGALDDPFRPTRDLDLLGFGDPAPEAMIRVFREICDVDANDAVAFDAAAITTDRTRDDAEYGGLRIKTTAIVDGAKVRVLIDIGFGDAVEPGLHRHRSGGSFGPARAAASRLFMRNRHRREISGHGVTWSRQYASEGFLRYLGFVANARIRARSACPCDCRDFHPSANIDPDRAPGRTNCRFRCRSWKAEAMGRLRQGRSSKTRFARLGRERLGGISHANRRCGPYTIRLAAS